MHRQEKDFEKSIVDWTADEKILLDNLLKESLQEEFHVSIPHDFADQVTEVMEKRKSIRESLLKHLMMSLGLIVIFAFTVALLFYFKVNQANVLLDLALKFKYPIAFVLLIITAIQLADSVLLSRTKDQLGE